MRIGPGRVSKLRLEASLATTGRKRLIKQIEQRLAYMGQSVLIWESTVFENEEQSVIEGIEQDGSLKIGKGGNTYRLYRGSLFPD